MKNGPQCCPKHPIVRLQFVVASQIQPKHDGVRSGKYSFSNFSPEEKVNRLYSGCLPLFGDLIWHALISKRNSLHLFGLWTSIRHVASETESQSIEFVDILIGMKSVECFFVNFGPISSWHDHMFLFDFEISIQPMDLLVATSKLRSYELTRLLKLRIYVCYVKVRTELIFFY